MGERRGTKALELWCRRITEGYPGVNVQNMTTSWRDGLAFCAMIHHFRPDLVDFDGLHKDDVYGNNELAFRTAEQHLGIPALLDAEDMASCAVPDRLSILTYLSQFYQTFGGLSPSRPAMKRAKEESDERLASSVSESPQPKVGVRLGVRKEPCVACGLPVFLAEKLVISRSLYHRTCFRCARCNNQLTLGNYYETEEGQYCCETCPDEEAAAQSAAPVMHQDYNQTALFGGGRGTDDEYPTAYKRALSDEEKTSVAVVGFLPPDPPDEEPAAPSEAAKMRFNFMTSHLLAGDQEHEASAHPTDNEGKTPDESDRPHHPHHDLEISPTPPVSLPTNASPTRSTLNLESRSEFCHVLTHLQGGEKSVNNVGLDGTFSNSSSGNQHSTAISTHDLGNITLRFNEDTKDTLAAGREETQSSGEPLSLVQRRLKIFENSKHAEGKGRANEPNSVVHIISKNKNRENDEAGSLAEQTAAALEEETRNSSPTLAVREDTKILKEEDLSEEAMQPAEPLKAAVISQKMLNSEEPRLHTSSLETSMSNVSGIDLSVSKDYPENLNPFQSDNSDDDPEDKPLPSIAIGRAEKSVSTNPFGSSDEDEDRREVTPPRPAARSNPSLANKTKDTHGTQPPTKRRLEAPQINLNPFWSDEEDCESDDAEAGNTESKNIPVPKPRTMKPTPEPSPVPRKTSLGREGLYASNSSIVSTGSLITPGGTYRKKKPAPPPPSTEEIFSPTLTFDTLHLKSPEDLESAKVISPRTTRTRKSKPAPPPPMFTSTPQSSADSFVVESKETEDGQSVIWDDQKNSKDETNRNRQSMSSMLGSEENEHPYSVPFIDKSAQGKWKRKKGPAPPRPIPHKRKIKVMSVKDVKLELDEIELQQQGLEKQGVRLEQLIRDKCETGQENEEFTSLRVDVEELVLELFALVNEKNELFRRQAELMLLRRQQRLEEEHADVEYQIRCLMSQPEATKTDSDKQREEGLIQRLVEIVERRNEIVECLEMDRRREVEEDRSINEQMGIFAAKSKADTTASVDRVHNSSISKKEKIKGKEKKVKKSHKKDADKDVDETEMKLKRHKRKWF